MSEQPTEEVIYVDPEDEKSRIVFFIHTDEVVVSQQDYSDGVWRTSYDACIVGVPSSVFLEIADQLDKLTAPNAPKFIEKLTKRRLCTACNMCGIIFYECNVCGGEVCDNCMNAAKGETLCWKCRKAR